MPQRESLRFRTRLVFSKRGDARFLSHRNVMDAFERAFRAADVPVLLTEGFNPHPRIAMGPALPLGEECASDPFDVETSRPIREDDEREANARLPEGLRIVGSEPLGPASPGIGKADPRGVYLVRPRAAFSGSFSEAVDRAVAAMGAHPLGTIAIDGSGGLRLELPLAGPTATTPKRFIDAVLGISPDAQLDLEIVRERIKLRS